MSKKKKDLRGALTLEQCSELMSINGGSLDISNSDVTELPDNLTVSGWLYINNTKISKLPENLRVSGGIDISETEITELPKSLDAAIIIRG